MGLVGSGTSNNVCTRTAKGIDLNVRNYSRTNGALPTKAKLTQR